MILTVTFNAALDRVIFVAPPGRLKPAAFVRVGPTSPPFVLHEEKTLAASSHHIEERRRRGQAERTTPRILSPSTRSTGGLHFRRSCSSELFLSAGSAASDRRSGFCRKLLCWSKHY